MMSKRGHQQSCQTRLIKRILHIRNQMQTNMQTNTFLEGFSQEPIRQLLKRVSKTRISTQGRRLMRLTSLMTQIPLFPQLKRLLRLSHMGQLKLFLKEGFLLVVTPKQQTELLITPKRRPRRKVVHLGMGQLSSTPLFKSTQVESQHMHRKFLPTETKIYWKTSNHQGINHRCEEQTSISKAPKVNLTSVATSGIRLQM